MSFGTVLALVLGLDDKTEENQKAVDLGVDIIAKMCIRDSYKAHQKLVNPANKRRLDIIVVGTGLAAMAIT